MDRSKRFTPWLTCSLRHQLDVLSLFWEAFVHAAITACRLFAHIFPPLSMDRYLFVHLSELGHSGENENVHASKQLQREFEALSIESPAFYRAPLVLSEWFNTNGSTSSYLYQLYLHNFCLLMNEYEWRMRNECDG